MADNEGLEFTYVDPLKLDYKLVTESFGGPFAERHLVLVLAETDSLLTLVVADPWDRELLESIARVKGKAIKPVMA
ncbi:MAG: type II/IV secretion system protein, partial [Myxococcota bacterium]|nr:type II/IV secretion system protein [Myxococcota bacterium]